MEHLPPVGWADVATKRDLDALEALDTRFEASDQKLMAAFRGVLQTVLTARAASSPSRWPGRRLPSRPSPSPPPA